MSPPVTSSLPDGSGSSGRRSSPVLPGSSGSSSHFWWNFKRAVAGHDLDAEDIEFLSKHFADSTASGYGHAFSGFRVFCDNIAADPYTCSPAVVVKYL